MVRIGFSFWCWVVAAWCLAGVLALSGCKVATHFVPKKEVKVIQRTVRTDSTIIEFVDTTMCPPNLTDTLVVTKRITKTLPPRDIIIHDTIVMREKAINRVLEKTITKNNWWLLLIGLLIGFYGKDYIRRTK